MYKEENQSMGSEKMRILLTGSFSVCPCGDMPMRTGRFGEYGQGESVATLHGIVVSAYSSEPGGPKLQVILNRVVGSMVARDSSWARGQGWFYSSVLLVMRERRKEGGGGRKTAVEDPVGNECLQSGPLGT